MCLIFESSYAGKNNDIHYHKYKMGFLGKANIKKDKNNLISPRNPIKLYLEAQI